MVGIVSCCPISLSHANLVMDLVTVGNPGNLDDTHGEGHGGVDYIYEMGKYEVTAGQYAEFLNAVASTDTYGLYHTRMNAAEGWNGCNIIRSGSPGSYTYSVSQDWADRPVNYVSFGDAARFSNWMHNGQPVGVQDLTTTESGSYLLDGATSNEALSLVTRQSNSTWVIPSENEWYKAAYHHNDGATDNYWNYPTSSDVVPSNDLVAPDPGNNATYYLSYLEDEFPFDWVQDWTTGGPYFRTEVGEHENSASPYGTFDQGGNIHEILETPISNSTRVTRGGTFWYEDPMLHAESRFGENSSHEWFTNGFRLAVVPEPGTIVFLSIGGLALVRRRQI